ncbi:unnamed protein product [Merluccius merluccius]
MGNLLKVLTCTDLEQEPNFFLDFENAMPTEAEREVWLEVDVVLKDAIGILDELQAYKGAGKEIREAIQNPNDEALQDQSWAAVVPLVGKLKKFYQFSQRLVKGDSGRRADTSRYVTKHRRLLTGSRRRSSGSSLKIPDLDSDLDPNLDLRLASTCSSRPRAPSRGGPVRRGVTSRRDRSD